MEAPDPPPPLACGTMVRSAEENDQPPSPSRVLRTDADDAVLVRRVLAGERAWFGVLVERYQRVLFNVALRTVRDRDLAKDVTQTAFLRAFEKLGSFDPRGRFFSWIYRITMNECLNIISRRRPQVEVPEDVPSPSLGPAEELHRDERNRALLGAVDALPPIYHQVIVLRYFVELNYQEIAEVIGVEEKTVKSRLFSARRLLAEGLVKRGVQG